MLAHLGTILLGTAIVCGLAAAKGAADARATSYPAPQIAEHVTPLERAH
jgi:hypothetical protein